MEERSSDITNKLIELVYGDNLSYLRSQLERGIHALDDAGAFTSTAMELLHKGPRTARTMAMTAVRDGVDDGVYMLDYHGDDSYSPPSSAAFYIRQSWHLGAVMDEIGASAEEFEDASHGLSVLGIGTESHYFECDWYWRGLAALLLTDLWINEESVETNSDFIAFAGKHSDIGSVISVAKERRSTNIKLLEAILSQSRECRVLRSGSL